MAVKQPARKKYRIGQLAWCPQLGDVLIIGVVRHESYQHNLLVELVERPERYWIDQDILERKPEGRREVQASIRERFTRLATNATYVPPN
jgi:hypothetical protein